MANVYHRNIEHCEWSLTSVLSFSFTLSLFPYWLHLAVFNPASWLWNSIVLPSSYSSFLSKCGLLPLIAIALKEGLTTLERLCFFKEFVHCALNPAYVSTSVYYCPLSIFFFLPLMCIHRSWSSHFWVCICVCMLTFNMLVTTWYLICMLK